MRLSGSFFNGKKGSILSGNFQEEGVCIMLSNKLAINWQLLGDSGDYLAIFRGFYGFGTFVGHIVHISNPEKGWWQKFTIKN